MPHRWLGGLLSAGLCLLAAGPLPAADRLPPRPEADDSEIEMGRGTQNVPRPPTAHDEKLKKEFAQQYAAARRSKRAVFEKYLDALGPEPMLDFLEATYPHCHAQGHDLGRAIFARFKELAPALNACGNRCTSACMHGVLMEAFSGPDGAARGPTEQHVTIPDVEKRMTRFCREDGEMARMHKPGNCAHGMGHALMVVAGHDVGRALAGCAAFADAPMEYYCATGVFMELFETSGRAFRDSLHSPCDTHTRFPAACYRYKIRELPAADKRNSSALAAECLKLPPHQRLGCFHGLGAAHKKQVGANPPILAEVCRHGTPDDQTLCVEGAIEKLADADEAKALAACASLTGLIASTCKAAAQGKMYRTDKPSMKLYTGK